MLELFIHFVSLGSNYWKLLPFSTQILLKHVLCASMAYRFQIKRKIMGVGKQLKNTSLKISLYCYQSNALFNSIKARKAVQCKTFNCLNWLNSYRRLFYWYNCYTFCTCSLTFVVSVGVSFFKASRAFSFSTSSSSTRTTFPSPSGFEGLKRSTEKPKSTSCFHRTSIKSMSCKEDSTITDLQKLLIRKLAFMMLTAIVGVLTTLLTSETALFLFSPLPPPPSTPPPKQKSQYLSYVPKYRHMVTCLLMGNSWIKWRIFRPCKLLKKSLLT